MLTARGIAALWTNVPMSDSQGFHCRANYTRSRSRRALHPAPMGHRGLGDGGFSLDSTLTELRVRTPLPIRHPLTMLLYQDCPFVTIACHIL